MGCKYCDWAYQNPANRPDEIFRLLMVEWNITKALQLVNGRKPIRVAVKTLLEHNALVYTDREHEGHVPLSLPVLIGWLPKRVRASGGGRQRYLIDGHHRVARAAKAGRKFLYAVLLTQEENDSIMRG
jgi:hypothetical protein